MSISYDDNHCTTGTSIDESIHGLEVHIKKRKGRLITEANSSIGQ